MTFGQLIKEAREGQGRTLKEVSFLTDVKISTLSAYEFGRAVPNLLAAIRILRALGIDPEYITEIEADQ